MHPFAIQLADLCENAFRTHSNPCIAFFQQEDPTPIPPPIPPPIPSDSSPNCSHDLEFKMVSGAFRIHLEALYIIWNLIHIHVKSRSRICLFWSVLLLFGIRADPISNSAWIEIELFPSSFECIWRSFRTDSECMLSSVGANFELCWKSVRINFDFFLNWVPVEIPAVSYWILLNSCRVLVEFLLEPLYLVPQFS